MKFADPRSVTCPDCATRSDQRVSKLLALQAVCPQCKSSLTAIGLSMRQSLDDWSNFILPHLLACALEKQMGRKFEEEELGQVKTLHDLAIVVERRLPPDGTSTSQAMSMVKSATEQIRREWSIANNGGREDALNLDVPLIDAISPHRWHI